MKSLALAFTLILIAAVAVMAGSALAKAQTHAKSAATLKIVGKRPTTITLSSPSSSAQKPKPQLALTRNRLERRLLEDGAGPQPASLVPTASTGCTPCRLRHRSERTPDEGTRMAV